MSAYDVDLVMDLDAEDLSRLALAVIDRMGQIGRDAGAALRDQIQNNASDDTEEGISQMEDAIGSSF